MKRSSGKPVGLAVALLGTVTLGAGASVGGDSTSYKFTVAPVHSMGKKSMADLRGKPVLIDFWGTR